MIYTSRMIRAKGVKLPSWTRELWEYIIRQTVGLSENGYHKYSWKDSGETGIPLMKNELILGKYPTFLKDLTFYWCSRERHYSVRQCSGWARNPNGYGQFTLAIPDSDMESIFEGKGSYTILRMFQQTFVHELTHVLDKSGIDSKKHYPTDKDWEANYEQARKDHANHPVEWRSFLSEIRNEIAGEEILNPGESVTEYLDYTSSAWRKHEKYLPPEGRRYILEAIGSDLIGKKDIGNTQYSSIDMPYFRSFDMIKNLYTKAKELGRKSPEARFVGDILQRWNQITLDGYDDRPEGYSQDTISDCLNDSLDREWRNTEPMIQDWVVKNI